MPTPDHAHRGNIPEIVWTELKRIASEAALADTPFLLDQCVEEVERVVREVVGNADAMPPAVVQFYARELRDRIDSLKK